MADACSRTPDVIESALDQLMRQPDEPIESIEARPRSMPATDVVASARIPEIRRSLRQAA